jgi:hypothetical protein
MAIILATELHAGDHLHSILDMMGFAKNHDGDFGIVRKVEQGPSMFADGQDGWYRIPDAITVWTEGPKEGYSATYTFHPTDEVKVRRFTHCMHCDDELSDGQRTIGSPFCEECQAIVESDGDTCPECGTHEPPRPGTGCGTCAEDYRMMEEADERFGG